MKKLTQKEIKEIKTLCKLFPRTIKVRVVSCEEGGFSAKVLEPKSLTGVITEGENLFELTEMINDAVYLALDIPEKYYPFTVAYIAPKSAYEHFRLLPSAKNILKFSRQPATCQ